jgi:hypothetical protein
MGMPGADLQALSLAYCLCSVGWKGWYDRIQDASQARSFQRLRICESYLFTKPDSMKLVQ